MSFIGVHPSDVSGFLGCAGEGFQVSCLVLTAVRARDSGEMLLIIPS